MDPLFVTYQDVSLYNSDLELLNGFNWLNDNIIAFYYEYLANETFKNKSELLFLTPSAVFMVSCITNSSELATALEPLDFKKRKYIFIPINNSSNATKMGGSHWSLVVYHKEGNQFNYYDSYGNFNLSTAVHIVNKIAPTLLGLTADHSKITVQITPQQVNGYDCGLYVLCITEALAHKFVEPEAPIMLTTITPSLVTEKRKKILDMIVACKLNKTNTKLFSL